MKRGIITINSGVVGVPTAPVWMMQEEIADMFNVSGRDIRKVISVIYKEGILSESDTKRYVRLDVRRSIDVYSIEIITAIAFRIGSKESMIFRKYIMNRIYVKNEYPILLFSNEFGKSGSNFN